MSRTTNLFVLGLMLWLGVGEGKGFSQVTATQPADPKLQRAYRSLHFSDLYPPEAVLFLQEKLQNERQAVPALDMLARDGRSEVRALVALLLGELGESKGAASLWLLLRDKSESVRIAASGALIQLHESGPVPVSLEGLKDERPAVRRLTAATLAGLSDKAAEGGLIETLQDPNEMVRMEAAKALRSCGTKAAAPPLVEALRDKSVLVRTAAVSALGVLAAAENVEPLSKMLADPDWHVRAATVLALGGLCQHPVEGAAVAEAAEGRLRLDDFALVRDRAADTLRHDPTDKAINALVQAVVSEDCDVRVHAAQSICSSRIGAALPLLMGHIHHPNPGVREKIVEIFGVIGGREQLPAVAEAMSDSDTNVRLAATNALRGLRQRGGADLVLVKLTDADAHVRAAAARLVGEMGDKSLSSHLLPLLQDDSVYVRSAAAESLGRLGDSAAVKPLIELLGGTPLAKQDIESGGVVIGTSLTNQFFLGLAELGGPQQKIRTVEVLGQLRATEAVDAIVEHGLKAEDAILRAVAAYSLGQIRDPRAVVPLQMTVKPYYDTIASLPPDWDTGHVIDPGIKMTADNDRLRRENEARVRASVAWALGQIADPSAVAILQKAINDQNSLVRDAAAEALAKIAEKQERLVTREPERTNH